MANVETLDAAIGAAVCAIRIDSKEQAVGSARETCIEYLCQRRRYAGGGTSCEHESAGKRRVHDLPREAHAIEAGNGVHGTRKIERPGRRAGEIVVVKRSWEHAYISRGYPSSYSARLRARGVKLRHPQMEARIRIEYLHRLIRGIDEGIRSLLTIVPLAALMTLSAPMLSVKET
jgi:hypothetical protein